MATIEQLKSKKPTKTRFILFEPYEEGRRRFLRFDINALADFEQETGMGFAQLMQQKATFAAARALIWAGLKHEDRILAIERVGELLWRYMKDPAASDSRTINDVLLVVLDAGVQQGAFGKVKEKDGNIEDVDELDEIEQDEDKPKNSLPPATDGEILTNSSNTNSEGSDGPTGH